MSQRLASPPVGAEADTRGAPCGPQHPGWGHSPDGDEAEVCKSQRGVESGTDKERFMVGSRFWSPPLRSKGHHAQSQLGFPSSPASPRASPLTWGISALGAAAGRWPTVVASGLPGLPSPGSRTAEAGGCRDRHLGGSGHTARTLHPHPAPSVRLASYLLTSCRNC